MKNQLRRWHVGSSILYVFSWMVVFTLGVDHYIISWAKKNCPLIKKIHLSPIWLKHFMENTSLILIAEIITRWLLMDRERSTHGVEEAQSLIKDNVDTEIFKILSSQNKSSFSKTKRLQRFQQAVTIVWPYQFQMSFIFGVLRSLAIWTILQFPN